MAKRREYDFETINKMSGDMKRQAVEHLAKVANERLRKLEKSGLTQYAYNKAYYRLNPNRYEKTKEERKPPKDYKPRFKTSLEKATQNEINKTFLELENFLQRPSSTVTGAKKAHERAISTLKKDRFTQSGSYARGLEITGRNRDDFFDFLTSIEYKLMERLVASEDLQEYYLDVKGSIPDKALFTLFDDFIAGKVGWNEMNDSIYHLQDLELRAETGELSQEEIVEYQRFFK